MHAVGVVGLGLAGGTTLAATANPDHDTITPATATVNNNTNNTTGTDDSAPGAAGSNDNSVAIDACTVIDEPGTYHLVADLTPDTLNGQVACIEILADDVTLVGNGHTIDLSNVPPEPRTPRIGVAINPHATGEEDEFRTEVTDLVVRGGTSGVSARFNVSFAEYRDVTVLENGAGVSLFSAGASLDNCVIEHNGTGVSLGGEPALIGSDLVMDHSTVRANRVGVGADPDSFARITHSRLIENEIGFRTSPDAGGRIRDSHICRNTEYGVQNLAWPGDEDDPDDRPIPSSTNAIDCYWGAPTGPSSFGDPAEPFTDPDTGRPADGDGDAISESLEPGVSSVRFDPFHETPIPGVGATR